MDVGHVSPDIFLRSNPLNPSEQERLIIMQHASRDYNADWDGQGPDGFN